MRKTSLINVELSPILSWTYCWYCSSSTWRVFQVCCGFSNFIDRNSTLQE